jgi:hypothetical protein
VALVVLQSGAAPIQRGHPCSSCNICSDDLLKRADFTVIRHDGSRMRLSAVSMVRRDYMFDDERALRVKGH